MDVDNTFTYYIAFAGGDYGNHWVHKFLHDEFYHCCVMAQTGRYCTYVNPEFCRVDFGAIYYDDYGQEPTMPIEYAILGWAQKGFKIVRYQHTIDKKHSIRHIGNWFPTCVTLIKIIIGLKSWSQTPYQLYKDLIKQGGEDITVNLLEELKSYGYS